MRGNKEEGGAEKAGSGVKEAKEEEASTAPVPEKVEHSHDISPSGQAGLGTSPAQTKTTLWAAVPSRGFASVCCGA